MIRSMLTLVALLLASPVAAAPQPARFNASDFGRLRISQRPCRLNTVQQTCVITKAEGSEVLRIDFSSGDRPFWVFTPSSAATSKGRPYRDVQGRTWLLSGNSSFQLVEQGTDGNVLRVAAP
ncbi:hypothetical protein KBY93_09290 [Synechococcus sp. J7-Johnson]|uniref:hypothetical protein n=1 Tax=Synechococcus sp. J7-Johnson TaxID=2823737 RepID=UPI0020CE6E07|nr:hypothetical protein [Synechococcus sp. J7-Johnson]MCP9840828.1 hypothetical protein [Synechococcus sp. J7-Johnson]